MSGLVLEEINSYEQTNKAKDEEDDVSFVIKDIYCNTHNNRNDVKLHVVEGERVGSRGNEQMNLKPQPIHAHHEGGI